MALPWLQMSTVRSIISKGAGPLKRKTSSHKACTCSKESLDLGETRLNSWMHLHQWYVSAVVEPSQISLQVFIWLKYSLQSSGSLVWHMAGERTGICRVYGNPNTKFNSWKLVNRCKYHTDIQKSSKNGFAQFQKTPLSPISPWFFWMFWLIQNYIQRHSTARDPRGQVLWAHLLR